MTDMKPNTKKLLRNIYEKTLFKKPALGTQPEWLENDTVFIRTS